MKLSALVSALLLPLAAAAQQNWITNAAGLSPQVRTLAGDTTQGPHSRKRHGGPFGYLAGAVVVNNSLYVADLEREGIFQVDITTGAVRLLAGGTSGFADGIGQAARFASPTGIATDGRNKLFVADCGNHRIRQINLVTGAVTTLAGSSQAGFANGSGSAAQFRFPCWLAADSTGFLYVTEDRPHIRRVEIATGVVQTLIGNAKPGYADGIGSAVQFRSSMGLALVGSVLYVVDNGNRCIRRVELATGAVTTLAGAVEQRGIVDGRNSTARFNWPTYIAADKVGYLYVAEERSACIRQVEAATGIVRTFAGSGTFGMQDGPGPMAEFDTPMGVAVDVQGNLYVNDGDNHRIRVIR